VRIFTENAGIANTAYVFMAPILEQRYLLRKFSTRCSGVVIGIGIQEVLDSNIIFFDLFIPPKGNVP
jgi:hypothetical protein